MLGIDKNISSVIEGKYAEELHNALENKEIIDRKEENYHAIWHDKIYIIPDVHCRNFYKPILNVTENPVVFLGDYMDPYSYEGHTDTQGINNLQEIIEYAKNNKNVTLLVGNHDCNSIWEPHAAFRSLWSSYPVLHKLFRDNIDLFTVAKRIGNTIFTHAGICKGWIESMNGYFKEQQTEFVLNEDNVIDYINNEFLVELKNDLCLISHFGYKYLNSPIFSIGRSRGGDSGYGGPLWCDFHEDFCSPMDWSSLQIFGHTQDPYNTGCIRTDISGACLDSRAIFEYYPETGLIKPSEINDEETKEEISEEAWNGDTICSYQEYERSLEEYLRDHPVESPY